MIELLESTDSTNAVALEAAANGAVHGAAWLADAQTSGRGRRVMGGVRREWFSPPGRNIYMSVLLRPHTEAAEVSGVTLAVGAHVCGALADATGLDVWLKWPNDIYIESRKLAGILTEGVTSVAGVEAVVVGIGLNVNLGRDEVPEELADVVTSARMETGIALDRLALSWRVYHAILAGSAEYFGGGWDAVRAEIERWDGSAGKTVEVELQGRRQRGEALGIGPHGQLRVRVDGVDHSVTSGEVRFL